MKTNIMVLNLPNFKNTFEYENNFYLSCDASRINKIIAHYELYKMSHKTRGEIIECGVFKGISLIRFAIFRDLFKNQFKKIIGFDTFGKFPKNKFPLDRKPREQFISAAGEQSISKAQLIKVLNHKSLLKNTEFIKGDITKTIPNYVKSHPKLKISFLNLDVDMYEPSLIILENLYPKIVKGGILVLDDYETWPGETKAVDEYFNDKNVKIQKFPYCKTPSYIIKK